MAPDDADLGARVPVDRRRQTTEAPRLERRPVLEEQQVRGDGRTQDVRGAALRTQSVARSGRRRRIEDLNVTDRIQSLAFDPVDRHVGSGGVGLQGRDVAPFLDHHDDVGPDRRLDGESVGASIAAPYSRHPSSAWTAGTLALNTSRNCARVPGARVTVART